MRSVPRFVVVLFVLFGLLASIFWSRTTSYASMDAAITLHPGFPQIQPYASFFSSPTIVDINGDRVLDILSADSTGCVWGFNSNGQLLAGFPWKTGGVCDNAPRINSSLAVGDINGDGLLEVVAGTRGKGTGVGQRGKVFVWNRSGQVLWTREMAWANITNGSTPEVMSVTLADIAGDKNLEVLAGTTNEAGSGTNNAPNFYAWYGNGTSVAGYPTTSSKGSGFFAQTAAADINNDGKAEFIAGRDEIYLYAYNGQGQQSSNWPVQTYLDITKQTWGRDLYMEFTRSTPSIADLDGDGTREIIIAGKVCKPNGVNTPICPDIANALIVTQPDGNRRPGWEAGKMSGAKFTVDYSTNLGTAIADLDGDGKLEIVVVFEDGTVRAYRENGVQIWSYTYDTSRTLLASEAAIADVTGDGKVDVVFGTYSLVASSAPYARMFALNGATGQLQAGFPLPFTAEGTASGTGPSAQKGIMAAPSIADLDGNCTVEIIAHSRGGSIYVWDTPGSSRPTLQPWSTSRGNIQRTGLYTPYVPPIPVVVPPPPASYTNKTYIPLVGVNFGCTPK